MRPPLLMARTSLLMGAGRVGNSPVPDLLTYAAHYMTMLISQQLLTDTMLSLGQVTHKNLEQLTEQLESNKAGYLNHAAASIQSALRQIYGQRNISLQQLSATFRRGDLLEFLQ